jgi:hypothetical protein
MFETVGRNGLRVAKHAAGRSAEEILERAERESITYPLVVKPSASAGADCVKFCEHPEDVRAACAQIHGQVNALGLVNEQVVVQEMLRGEEFIVNTVSTDGVHRVADILICGKRRVPGHGMLSEVEKLVPCNGQEQAHLVQYVYRVLDALGIRFGPSHIELMYTPEGPMLIELAARLQGAIDPNAMALCTGTSHVHLSVDALVDPDGFLQQAHCGYPFRNNLYRVLLSSRRSGVLAGLPGLDCIRRLASFHDVQMWVGPGDRVNETLDFVHCPGYLHLVHSDRNVVERDYQVVRSLQDDGLFDWQT